MEHEYITISQLNHYIKGVIDNNQNLNKVYLKGEISNFKAHTRGHLYFTLKDEDSRLNAVMFLYQARNLKFQPVDGMKVLVCGKISVYEATGSYQIYVESMEEDGLGKLYIEFEKLKKKLAEEGLFDPAKKKPIPKVPRRIGIVTASTGAAIRDILTTIKRRYPLCETILFPSLVQGTEAAADIVKNIEIANTYDIDTLIVGRGGGSIEDLWPFNEEIVARAIYNSRVPVISAVGHEIDFTIADFVADLRAPTPTAAAELAVPNIDTIKTYLENVVNRSTLSINNIIDNRNQILNRVISSYILKNPMAMYEIKEQKLDFLIEKLVKQMGVIKSNIETKFAHLDSQLKLLNPHRTVERGYGIVKNGDDIISDVKKLKKDDIITIEMRDGKVTAKTLEVINE